MYLKTKTILAMLCLAALLLCSCGEKIEKKDTAADAGSGAEAAEQTVSGEDKLPTLSELREANKYSSYGEINYTVTGYIDDGSELDIYVYIGSNYYYKMYPDGNGYVYYSGKSYGYDKTALFEIVDIDLPSMPEEISRGSLVKLTDNAEIVSEAEEEGKLSLVAKENGRKYEYVFAADTLMLERISEYKISSDGKETAVSVTGEIAVSSVLPKAVSLAEAYTADENTALRSVTYHIGENTETVSVKAGSPIGVFSALRSFEIYDDAAMTVLHNGQFDVNADAEFWIKITE